MDVCVEGRVESLKINLMFGQGRSRGYPAEAEKIAAKHVSLLKRSIDLHDRTGRRLWLSDLAYVIEILVNPENPRRYMCMRRPCGAGRGLFRSLLPSGANSGWAM
jgi:hypothetical protein